MHFMLMIAAMLSVPGQDGPLAPLSFLVGHCWEGELGPGMRNTHCFETIEGERVRDRHVVVREGETVYSGETVYEWDAAAGAIRFTYSSGGRVVGEGHVREIAAGLDFGTSEYAAGDGKVTIGSRWLRVGTDAYDAIDSAPAAPAFDRTVRYRRVE